ncbi:hypothetical protein Bbelb_137700 [Branchiostoma belcheri]|nr:hypothetical protein Bbelb_137700 [Branchiostoma belcheri]
MTKKSRTRDNLPTPGERRGNGDQDTEIPNQFHPPLSGGKNLLPRNVLTGIEPVEKRRGSPPEETARQSGNYPTFLPFLPDNVRVARVLDTSGKRLFPDTRTDG